jgi:hypothetical protein
MNPQNIFKGPQGQPVPLGKPFPPDKNVKLQKNIQNYKAVKNNIQNALSIKTDNTKYNKSTKSLNENVIKLLNKKKEIELLLLKTICAYFDTLLEGQSFISYITYVPQSQSGGKYKQKGGTLEAFKQKLIGFLSCFRSTRVMADDILSNGDYVMRLDSIVQSQTNQGQGEGQRQRQVPIYRANRVLLPGLVNQGLQGLQGLQSLQGLQDRVTMISQEPDINLDEFTKLIQTNLDDLVQSKILEKYIESFDELFREASHRAFRIDIDHISEDINPVIEIMQDRYRIAILYAIKKLAADIKLPTSIIPINSLKTLIDDKFLYKEYKGNLKFNMNKNIFTDDTFAINCFRLCDFIKNIMITKCTLKKLKPIFETTQPTANITDNNIKKLYMELTFYLDGFDNIENIDGISYTYEVNPELVIKIFKDKMTLKYSDKNIRFKSTNYTMKKEIMYIAEKDIKNTTNENEFIMTFNSIKKELETKIKNLHELELTGNAEYTTLFNLYKSKILNFYLTDGNHNVNIPNPIILSNTALNIVRIYMNLKYNSFFTKIAKILKDEDNQILVLNEILEDAIKQD